MKCAKCGKNIPYNPKKPLCLTCWKENQQSKTIQTPKVDQATCDHSESHKTSCPTRSGCTIIYETICNKCGKVLEHSSESVESVFMQNVLKH